MRRTAATEPLLRNPQLGEKKEIHPMGSPRLWFLPPPLAGVTLMANATSQADSLITKNGYWHQDVPPTPGVLVHINEAARETGALL